MTGVYREVIFGRSVLHNTKLEVAIEVKTGQTILYSVVLLFLDIEMLPRVEFLILAFASFKS